MSTIQKDNFYTEENYILDNVDGFLSNANANVLNYDPYDEMKKLNRISLSSVLVSG